MSLTLRVIAPDQSVFDDTADEIILPIILWCLEVLSHQQYHRIRSDQGPELVELETFLKEIEKS